MATQFKIAVTKDIIRKCRNCGNDMYSVEKNCAIAHALIHIFPNIYVTNYFIFPFGIHFERDKNVKILLPPVAQQFIKLFDGLRLTPELRLLLPEFEFTIDLPDEVIEQVNIDEIKEMSVLAVAASEID